MSRTYEGPAEVATHDTTITVQAELHASRDSSGWKEWNGVLYPDTDPVDLFNLDEFTLRLPDGREGRAFATAAAHGDAHAAIQGTGPAPWDTGL